MGFRMRKSMKIAPGVRLSVSKSGVGASVGGTGGRYSVHSSGRRTTTVGSGIVPGVYYQSSKSGSSRRASGSGSTPARQQAAPPSPGKPGMFAPKGEKELFRAIKAQDAKAIKSVGVYYKDFQLPSYSLAGLMMLTDEPNEAEQLLSEVFATGKDPADDKFVSNYLFTRLELSLAQGVMAELPVNRDAVGLALAELKQAHGDLKGAIDVVEQLEPTTYSAVSLAELYAQTERWDDVIELTEGMKNEDDASALLCVFRGQAFHEQGFHDAAHEAYKEALRSRSRAAPIRHMALAERAQNYLAQGKKSMARKDLERILAEDSGYEGVRDQLAELAG
jgi:tetratricopeptide (TPR) repeat protein